LFSTKTQFPVGLALAIHKLQTIRALASTLKIHIKFLFPAASIPVVVRSNCRKHRSRRSSELGAWPLRAKEPCALWGAWRPHSTISGRARWGVGSTAFDLWQGAISDGACLPRATISGEVRLCLHCQRLVLGVFLFMCCVFLLFLQYLLSMYYSNFIEIFVG
jgi:hypothetical protein